jgi:glutaredoxin
MKSLAVPLAALALTLAAAPAYALYKVVNPDGTVTYTDRPPAAAGAKITAMTPGGTADPGRLPDALRQTVARWPVTLYTSPNCSPCVEARRMLRERGVPHAEKTVFTDDDRAAWQDVVGGPEAPALKIGAQTLRGLQTDRWVEYLDAAGYPRTSKLPVGYQFAEAEPLVPKRTEASRTPPPRPTAPPPPIDDTPGGIRF